MIITEKNERKKKKTNKQQKKSFHRYTKLQSMIESGWAVGWGVRAGVEIVLGLLSYYAKSH